MLFPAHHHGGKEDPCGNRHFLPFSSRLLRILSVHSRPLTTTKPSYEALNSNIPPTTLKPLIFDNPQWAFLPKEWGKYRHSLSSFTIPSFSKKDSFLIFLPDLFSFMVRHFHIEKHRIRANDSSRILPRPHTRGIGFKQIPSRNTI